MQKKTHSVFEDFPYQMVLASSSPRRQELLKYLGVAFSIQVPAIEERQRPGETAEHYVQRNSREKAEIIFQSLPKDRPYVVIGSDTIGLFEAEVLEKPLDAPDAMRMLRLMSGKTHEVLTGLTLVYSQALQHAVKQTVVRTSVQFKSLTEQEIRYYVATGEPLDKAGSYGIQGIGGFLVEKLNGSYSNVVGLPLVELVDLLRCLPDPLEVSKI